MPGIFSWGTSIPKSPRATITPIGGFEYLVDIIHTLLILYLGDNLDGAFVLVEYSLYIENILFAAYERVSDEVDILFNGIADIANVFLL